MGMAEVIPINRPLTHLKRKALIDEFGRLQQRVDAHKPDKDRHAVLREQIATWYDSAPANQPYLEEGMDFTLMVGERANERVITHMPRLFKLLGAGLFLKLCKFPLGAIDASLPAVQHKTFLIEEQTGPRKLKVVAKPVAIPEAIAA
jgi:hypothetical protein